MIKTKFIYICNACGQEFQELEYAKRHVNNHIIRVRRVIKEDKIDYFNKAILESKDDKKN